METRMIAGGLTGHGDGSGNSAAAKNFASTTAHG